MFYPCRNPPPTPTTGRSPFKSRLIEFASPFRHRRQLLLAVSCPESLVHHWATALLLLIYPPPSTAEIRLRGAAFNLWTRSFIQSNDFSRTIKIGLAPFQVYTLSQCSALRSSPRPAPPCRQCIGKEHANWFYNGPIAKGWRAFVRIRYVACAAAADKRTRERRRAVNQGSVGLGEVERDSACCLKPVWCLAIMHASSINKHNEWSRVQRSGSCSDDRWGCTIIHLASNYKDHDDDSVE